MRQILEASWGSLLRPLDVVFDLIQGIPHQLERSGYPVTQIPDGASENTSSVSKIITAGAAAYRSPGFILLP